MAQIAKTFYRIFCCYSDQPLLRNFDKVIQIVDSFKNGLSLDYDPDVKIVDHSKSYDLCQWSNQILDLLTNVETEIDVKEKYKVLTEHILSIKQFYSIFPKEKNRMPKFDNLLDVIRSYECIVSLAFQIFLESQNTMIEINVLLKKFDSLQEEYNKKCFTLIDRIGNRGIFNEFDVLIEQLNSKFGEFNLYEAADFVKKVGAFMCKYNTIDLNDTTKLAKNAELITETAMFVNEKLSEYDPDFNQLLFQRFKKSNLLTLTKKIAKNLDKFDSKEPVIGQVYRSFEQIYISLFKVIKELEDLSSQKQTNEINFRNVNPTQLENLIKEMELIKNLVQDIETIIFFMIFYFENREDVLYPLSGHLNEISRILENFLEFHIVYRVSYGRNYLNKTKSVANRIITMFETNLDELKEPVFILNEFRRRYIDLVILDSIGNVHQPNDSKSQSLDEIGDIISNLIDSIMDQFRS